MSATIARKNMQIRAFGTQANVPKNPIANLMYYLNCVATVIDYHDPILTDYHNYDLLSDEELLAVYTLATLLNPQLFIEAGIFIVDQSLLLDFENQFYEISDETIGIHVNSEIIIGGKTVKVLKVMACNENWLVISYYRPMNQINTLIREKERERERESRNYGHQIINTQTSFQDNSTYIIPVIQSVTFEGEPVSCICQFCRKAIITITKSKFNFVACFCFLFSPLLYCCVQICGKKNILCCDITHICPNCGAVLGHYNSC